MFDLQGSASAVVGSSFEKARIWDRYAIATHNTLHRFILNKLFDGFEGKLTSSKWATLTQTSPDTALRDIQDLINKRILVNEVGGGRSTSYILAE